MLTTTMKKPQYYPLETIKIKHFLSTSAKESQSFYHKNITGMANYEKDILSLTL